MSEPETKPWIPPRQLHGSHNNERLTERPTGCKRVGSTFGWKADSHLLQRCAGFDVGGFRINLTMRIACSTRQQKGRSAYPDSPFLFGFSNTSYSVWFWGLVEIACAAI